MRVKALKGFAGKVTMYAGEVKDIPDDAVARDLLAAGYVKKIEPEEAKIVVAPAKKSTDIPEKSSRKKKRK